MIQKTKDYSMFQVIDGNRDVRPDHVKKLAASIAKHNMLSKNPIIVDSNMNVIDGQHRLAAASSLKKSIYYIVADDYNFGDVLLLNTSSRKWGADDFLNAYIKMGKEDYKILAAFSKKYELPISISVALLQEGSRDTMRGKTYSRFTNGDFVVETLEQGSYIAETIHATKDFCEPAVWKARDYVLAIMHILNDFPKETIVKKLASFGKKIQRARTYKDYLRQLEDVFNKFKRGEQYRFF